MKRVVFVMLMIAGIMLSATLASTSNEVSAQRSSDVAKLTLSIVPPKVPADGDSYKIIYISLTDSKNNPTIAGEDLQVGLASSNTNAGSVDTKAEIKAGSYYTVATFRATDTAGSTTISAAATGYTSAQATITTVKTSDRNPEKLDVVALPSPISPREGSKGIVIVRLLNSLDSPVAANEDLKVSLSSSDEKVVKVDPSVTIPRGQVYQIANYETGTGSGKSTITASAESLGFAAVTVGTSDSVTSQLQLKVYPLPDKMSTKDPFSFIVIQLEDSRGMPVRSAEDIDIKLFTSNDQIVIPKFSSTKLKKDESFVVEKILPKREGEATIRPVASGFLSVAGNIKIVEPNFKAPRQDKHIELYYAPKNPDPTSTDYVLIAAQLQTKDGVPSPEFRQTRMQLSSSNVNVASFGESVAGMDLAGIECPHADVLIVLDNESFGCSRVKLAGLAGDTTITAVATGFTGKDIQLPFKGIAGFTIDLVPTSPNVPAYDAEYPAFLAMYKSGDTPLIAQKDIDILLKPNSDLVSVPRSVTIKKGESFGVVNITPKGFPGMATITAKSTSEDFKESIKSVTLTEFNPSAIAVFTAFPTLVPTSAEGDDLVIVQLQNSKGEPVKNVLSDTSVPLSLSSIEIGAIEQNVVIPKGKNFATAKIFLNTVQTDGTITANAEGYKLVSSKFKTVAFPLNVKLTIQPDTIDVNQTASLTVKVTSEKKPVPNAKVSWVHDQSAAMLTTVSETTNASGEATAVFIPRKEVAQQLSVSVSKPGYLDQTADLSFALGETTPQGFRPQFSTDFLSMVLVAAIAVEGFVIYRFYQKKKPLF